MRPSSLAILCALLCAGVAAHADTTALINFDDRPQAPGSFFQAGPVQTVAYPQATYSGGVIIGVDDGTFPAQVYASSPNHYGTSNLGFPARTVSTLLPTLTIAISPTYQTTEVSFALFNGMASPQAYTVQAFDGATLLETLNYPDIPANYNLGYVLPDLMGPGITSVLISANSTSSYDFLIDDVAFNESVQQAVGTTPEPSSLALLGTGLLGAVRLTRRRHRAA